MTPTDHHRPVMRRLGLCLSLLLIAACSGWDGDRSSASRTASDAAVSSEAPRTDPAVTDPPVTLGNLFAAMPQSFVVDTEHHSE